MNWAELARGVVDEVDMSWDKVDFDNLSWDEPFIFDDGEKTCDGLISEDSIACIDLL